METFTPADSASLDEVRKLLLAAGGLVRVEHPARGGLPVAEPVGDQGEAANAPPRPAAPVAGLYRRQFVGHSWNR